MSNINDRIGSPKIDSSCTITNSYSTDSKNEYDLAVLEPFACSSDGCIHPIAIPLQSQRVHTHHLLPGVSYTKVKTVPPVAIIAVTSLSSTATHEGVITPSKCSRSETLLSQGYGLSKEVQPEHSILESAH